jgi:transposase
MGQERRHFTDEFKTEAVALLASSGRPLVQIAGELGISPLLLRNWRNWREGRDAGSAPFPKPALHSVADPAAEISRLCRENDRLRLQRDILKRQSRSSRKRRDEVPLDRGSPGCLAGAGHVRCAEHLALWFLRLAITAGEPAQDRRSRAAERYPAPSRRPPWLIWGTAHPRQTAC